jgi:hypothetical protein
MNSDATVVFNEAGFAKAIHEEADARSGSSNHFRQGFLGNRWNQRFRFSWLTNSASDKRVLAKRFSLELKS